jgi:hypothetical protein
LIGEVRTELAKSAGPETTVPQRATFGFRWRRLVNRSALEAPGKGPLSAMVYQTERAIRMGTGGEGATGFEPSLA